MRIDTRFWFTFIFCILASVSTVLIYLNHNKNLRLNGGQDKVSSVRNATLGVCLTAKLCRHVTDDILVV